MPELGRTGAGRRPSAGRRCWPGPAEEAERIQQSWGPVTAAVDAIRARYGGSSVGPGVPGGGGRTPGPPPGGGPVGPDRAARGHPLRVDEWSLATL